MNWRFGICTVLYAFSVSCGNAHLAVAVPIGDEAGEENIISLVGSGCEPVRADESRSSVRLRAADKASFNAVEKISELSEYRDSLSSHDFNVLVYNIIDNYIEDQTVRTVSQNEGRICVEMTGWLNSENILRVLNDNFQKYVAANEPAPETAPSTVQDSRADYPESLLIEETADLQAPGSILPPKPQPSISPKVAALAKEPAAPVPANVPTPVASNAAPAIAVDTSQPEESVTYVFLDKTVFYNNSTTVKFYQDLKTAVEERPGVKITLDKGQAAYTLKSRVLRAKVDPVNQQTNRLQMVIAVELEQSGKSLVVEHQNRFVLFDDKDDEQKVAADLIRKLLVQAAHIVAKKIKSPQSEAIITPAGSNYGVFAPTPQP